MIINIRGTNGSGKSTVVKKFLQRFPHVELFGALGPRRPEAYKVRLAGNGCTLLDPISR
jgi:ABC-type cobalamin/Fe3+-siderophores transport system ATPase subunit